MVVGEISTGVDVLVIGGGPAGYLAAIRAAQHDMDVMLVDRDASLGGTCLNDGCIPSKALIHVADLFHETGHAEELGIEADPVIDTQQMQDWKGGVVDTLTGGVKQLEERYGVEVIKGEAYLQSGSHARIAGSGDAEAVDFEHCIIATGSEPVTLDGFEVDGETVITSKEALKLGEVPDRMVIVGGGYIGMELSMVYAKLGSDVTVVEAGDRPLSRVADDIAEPVISNAEELGIEFVTGARAEGADVSDGTATITLETETGGAEREADVVLVAVGRKPYVGDMGLENTNVEVDGDGFIVTDDRLRTDEEGVFAAGDVAGDPMLAHKGYQEGRVAADVIAGEPAAADFVVPAVIYTDPEIATVGMTAAEAEEREVEVTTGTFRFAASGRAATMAATDGFIRTVVERETGALLGVEMVGPNVSELVAEATLAIEMGALVEDIRLTVHAHPTLAEAFREACEDALGEAPHRYNPGDG